MTLTYYDWWNEPEGSGPTLGYQKADKQLTDAVQGLIFNVKRYGAKGDGVTDDTEAIQAAIDAADAAGTAHSNNTSSDAPGVTFPVVAPPGVYLTRGIDLNGKNAVLVGYGPSSTRFRAHPSATGYVIDMTDWAGTIKHARGATPVGNFSIEGTYAADTALGGLKVENAVVHLSRIGIFGTGGTPLDVGDGVHLSHFDHIHLYRPVDADTNDVPYLHVGSSNGNSFYRLALRSGGSSTPDGSKVVWVEGSHNTFMSPWFEFLFTPSGGSYFHIDGSRNLIDNVQIFDQEAESSPASSHCIARLAGGVNEVRGYMPAHQINGGTGAWTWEYAVIIEGDGNRVVGNRGYQNNHVYLAAGVNRNFVELGGAEGVPGATPWVDDSGTSTNVLIDHSTGTRIPLPEITGSTGANAALQNLLTELEGLGLITDSTT